MMGILSKYAEVIKQSGALGNAVDKLSDTTQKQQPSIVSKPVSTTTKPTVQTPTAKHSEWRNESVIVMQNLLTELSNSLSKNKALIAKTIGIPEAYITTQLINNLAATGGKYGGQNDGVWGKNTTAALSAYNSFVKSSGLDIATVEIGNEEFYKKTQDEISKTAEENSNAIRSLFSKLNITPSEKTKKETSSVKIPEGAYDMIPSKLTMESMSDPSILGTVEVTPNDVNGLANFYAFIRQNITTAWDSRCGTLLKKKKTTPQKTEEAQQSQTTTASIYDVYIEKIAEHILDNSIYKLSQEAPSAEIEYTRDVPEEKGVCFDVFMTIMNWFATRSEKLLRKLRSENAPKDKIENAEKYHDAISTIIGQWGILQDKIWAKLEKENRTDKPMIFTEDLFHAANKTRKEEDERKTKGRLISTRDGETGYRSESLDDRKKTKNGPIQGFIRIEQLIRDYGLEQDPNVEAIRSISANSNLLPIEFNVWSNVNNWVPLAQQNVRGPGTEMYTNFPRYANLIGHILNAIYAKWVAEESDNSQYADEEQRNQLKNLSAWGNRIQDIISTAQRVIRNPGSLEKLRG
jgi:hypothetical protein